MIDATAQKGRNGVLVDLAFYDFNDDPHTVSGPGANELVAKGDFEMTLLDFGGIYNPSADGMGFSLVYGARMLDVDQELQTHIETPAGPTPTVTYTPSQTYWDGLVGVRWIAPISDKWLVNAKADLSTGSTDYTWSALGGVGYSFGDKGQYTALAGYRYMELRFDQDDTDAAKIETKITLNGPYMAFRFGF